MSASDHLKFERFCYDLAAAFDATNASFLFIPFGYRMPWDDRLANSSVAARCKFWKKNAVVYEELSIQKTLNIISSLDGMISTRLHSTIFSLSNKIPFIDITHNHKNKRLLSTISYEEASILYSEFSYQKCMASLQKILTNKKIISQEIQNLLNIQISCLKGVSDNVHLV
jgi:polysaccharide pyruvyl transferase WcaK-like protein